MKTLHIPFLTHLAVTILGHVGGMPAVQPVINLLGLVTYGFSSLVILRGAIQLPVKINLPGFFLLIHSVLPLLAQASGVPSVQPVINLLTAIAYVIAIVVVIHAAMLIHRGEVPPGLFALAAAGVLALAVTIVRYYFASQGVTVN